MFFKKMLLVDQGRYRLFESRLTTTLFKFGCKSKGGAANNIGF